MDLPTSSDTDNNDDEAPFFDALDELPFSDCADSFSDESDPSPETSFPAVTLCRRRSASVTFPDYELPDSSSGSSVTSEVGWIADTEEIFAGIKKVGNYRSLEEKLDKSELTQNDEISTVTSASRVFLDDSVDSAPGRDGGSLFNLLIFMAGLVIKAVGFQINLITAFVTFPVWGSYKLYKFVINPLRTIRLGRDYFSGKLFKLCEFGFGLISPYIHQWLKKHKSVSNVALRWGWGLLCSFYVCFILFGILASSFVISGVIVRYFVAEPFHMKQVLNFDFTKQRPVAYVPITSCAGVGCGIDCEKHVEDRRRSGFRAVPPGHKVKVTVTMILPESEYNRNLGMFQVRLDFLSNNGEILASSRRPCMIQFRSEPIRLLSTAVKIAPLIAGYISESQTLTVKFKGFSEGNVPTACLKVTIEQRAEYLPGAGIPELYDTSLTLASELPLFKRILWYWKKTIFIWVTMASFMMLVLCTLVFCRPIIMPRSRPRSRAVRRTVAN